MSRRLAFAVFGLALAAASPALAAKRVFSYDPASPDAKRLTGEGLTFVFKPGLLGRVTVLRVMSTAVAAKAALRRAGQDDLGPGGLSAAIGAEAMEGDLYEVDPASDQGRVYVRAFCPGSKRLWLVMNRLSYGAPLRVHVLGDDPAGGPGARRCATLDFTFRGEWKLPNGRLPDPMEEPFDKGGAG